MEPTRNSLACPPFSSTTRTICRQHRYRETVDLTVPPPFFLPSPDSHSRVASFSLYLLGTSRRTQNMRESAMGRSKRKRSSRVSSGGGSMRASHGLGPLQEVCHVRGPDEISDSCSRGAESNQETKDFHVQRSILPRTSLRTEGVIDTGTTALCFSL